MPRPSRAERLWGKARRTKDEREIAYFTLGPLPLIEIR
jgi:hypothetical protein